MKMRIGQSFRRVKVLCLCAIFSIGGVAGVNKQNNHQGEQDDVIHGQNLRNTPQKMEQPQRRRRELLLGSLFGAILDEFFPEENLGETLDNLTEEVLGSAVDGAIQNLTEEIFGVNLDKVQNISEELSDVDFEELLQNLTKELFGIGDSSDDNTLFGNLTMPEEYMGTINIDLLFSSLFDHILSFFGVEGYDYKHSNANLGDDQSSGLPFRSQYFSDPVPFGSECKLCDGEFDRTQQFAGLSCAEWEIFAGFSRAEECSILRAAAVKSCSCDSSTTRRDGKCPSCAASKGNYRGLPTLSGHLFCSSLVDLPPVDGQTTCDDIAKFGEMCGCSDLLTQPPAVPSTPATAPAFQCTLCQNGATPTSPDKVVLHGNGGMVMEMTCNQVQDKLATLTTEEQCNQSHKQVSMLIGTSVELFCDCPASATRTQCQSCPAGSQLIGPTDEQDDTSIVMTTHVISKAASPTEETSVDGGAIAPSATTCMIWGEQMKTLLESDPLCEAFQSKAMADCCIVAENMWTLAAASLTTSSAPFPYGSRIIVIRSPRWPVFVSIIALVVATVF